MNKKLLVVAIGAALAAPAFAQSSNVTLYGRIHQSLESIQTGTTSSQGGVREVGSRLGVRGVEDFGGGLKGVFGYETGLTADEVSTAVGNTRNAYVGLDTGSTGTLVIGVLDAAVNAPLYSQIFKGITDINHDGGTAQFAAGRADTLRGNQRLGDALGYKVKLGGVEVASRLAMQSGGFFAPSTIVAASAATNPVTGNGTAGTATAARTEASTTNGEQGARNFSIAATTNLSGVDLGVGYERDDYTAQANEIGQFKNRLQLVAGTKVGAIKVGGILARNSFQAGGNGIAANNDTENEFGLSLAYDVNAKSQAILNYLTRENAVLGTAGATPDVTSPATSTAAASAAAFNRGAASGLTADSDRRQVQVGYKYNFSNRTMGYAMYQRLDFDTKVSGDEQKAVIMGLRHNF